MSGSPLSWSCAPTANTRQTAIQWAPPRYWSSSKQATHACTPSRRGDRVEGAGDHRMPAKRSRDLAANLQEVPSCSRDRTLMHSLPVSAMCCQVIDDLDGQ